MANVTVYNMEGNEVGTMELNDAVFGVEINEHLVHLAVVRQLANNRQGTQKAKTRSEVRGGGRKPWRQKGTGRARQGSIRSPQWVHGGVVFAPKSRDFSKKVNSTAKRVALFSALSEKVRENNVVIVDKFDFAAPKTKEMVAFNKAFGFDKTVLLVLDGENVNARRAASNLQGVETINVDLINTYDVVRYAKVVMSKAAVEKLEEVYGE